MTLAMDITDGRGLNNKACHVLLPKKSKVRNSVFATVAIRHLTSSTLLIR